MALHTIVEHDTTHIKPYIDAKIQDVNSDIQTLSNVRAELGAHNLGKKYNEVTNIGLTIKDTPDGGNYINGTAASSGGRLNLRGNNFVLKAGTYTIVGESNDHSKYSSVILQKTSDNSVLGSYEISYAGVDKSRATFTLAADTECYFGFNTTSGTAYGTDTFIIYPMVKLADDKDDTFYPYAMTNKELTDAKANKSDLASISITGTTNNTGATIVSGTYFYLNGTLVRAKTAIANGATFTSGTNYETVTVGGDLIELDSLVKRNKLANNTDLNNIVSEGNYYNDRIEYTFSNSPVTEKSFYLEVKQITDNRYLQILHVNESNSYFYMRTNYGGTWQSWYKYEGTAVT